MPDELDRRIRRLEAERLRPVPPPPGDTKRPTTAAERTAARRAAATQDQLAELVAALREPLDHDQGDDH